ncbi:MAG: type I restriction endonuclease subunit R [Candidatus Bilamarchaeaceae archaeon]
MTFSEKTADEDYFVEQLQKKGWKLTEEPERDLDEPLLTSNLIRMMKTLNPGIGDEEIKKVINELKLRPSGTEGNKQILRFLKEGISVKSEKDNELRRIALFDYENPKNNEFLITKQMIFKAGKETIRTDILLYVNGIPLVDIECKSSVNLTQTWLDAYMQIKRYEKQVPELYKYIQIGVATKEIAKYFAIAPWNEDVDKEEWKENGKDSVDSAIQMLEPSTLLNIIRNYLWVRTKYSRTTKVIARYMQYRASERIVERVLNKINNKDKKNRGLIWHWQGSGKTLTMIFAAHKLYYYQKELEKPTVFFIVDRLELASQLYDEFNALDVPAKAELLKSIWDLAEALKHDHGKGRRTMMICTIQKFSPSDLQGAIEKIKGNETITSRQNAITFIDEAHRTQYGTFAAQLKAVLKNGFMFAFTGTPITKDERDTYANFSYEPEKYLDRYFMRESIIDGFTKKLTYQPRLEKGVHLDRAKLDTFLEVQYEDGEIPEDLDSSMIKDEVKKRLSAINVFLENEDRIGEIAKDITKHFKENVDGKFKAMVVAANRKSCVIYKRELDKLLDPRCSEIVMTYNREKDKKIIEDYRKELEKRNEGSSTDEIRDEIQRRYKEEENPKILIVTDMLLTGFDVPILQTMYLDKPLKEHRLLQAIARTNRPYKDAKESGLIIDYVGILKDFKKAFKAYSEDDIKGVLGSMDDLKDEFKARIKETSNMFKAIPKDKDTRETLRKAFEIITESEENTKKFNEDISHLMRLFEMLGSDEIKIEYFPEYKWLVEVFYYYRLQTQETDPEKDELIRRYLEKTLKYIHKSTEIQKIKEDLPEIKFDAEYMEKLEEKLKTKEEKAANIVFTLNRMVLVDKERTPVYETLIGKVERLVTRWKEKTKDYEKIYDEGSRIINEINSINKRQEELGMNDMEYLILQKLEATTEEKEGLSNEVRKLNEKLAPLMFTNWTAQISARKNVEREIRIFLRRYVMRHKIPMEKLDEIYGAIAEKVKMYGNN